MTPAEIGSAIGGALIVGFILRPLFPKLNKSTLNGFALKKDLEGLVSQPMCDRIHADEAKLQAERDKLQDDRWKRIDKNLERIWNRLDGQQ